jgi:hypothetical protein
MDELTTGGQRRLPKFQRNPVAFGPLRLSATDLEILRLVHDYRYVTTDHVLALLDGNKRHLAERLQGLFHHQYLQRLLPPRRMRVADEPQGGSDKFAYVLEQRGAETLSESEDIPLADLAWDPKYADRTEWHLEHRLMIATFRATVELALRSRSDLQFVEWRDEPDIRDEVFVRRADGKVEQHKVAPDGYFCARQSGRLIHFFLEADRGTKEHTGLLKKFTALWWYSGPNSPFFQKYADPKDVRFLFVSRTPKRLAAMRRTLSGVDERQRGLRRFWFCLTNEYELQTPETILDAIWRVGATPAGNQSRVAEEARPLFE